LDIENLHISAMIFVVSKYLSNIDRRFAQTFIAPILQKNILKSITENSQSFQNAYDYVISLEEKNISKYTALDKESFWGIKSIFNNILNFNSPEPLYLNIASLGFENRAVFPSKNGMADSNGIKQHLDKFYDEMVAVTDIRQCYFIIQKYFYCLPVNNQPECSLSVFNAAKLTAALCICLSRDKDNLLLIKGDVSGIQDFIFSVPGKGASKGLKGRSTYLSVLSDIIAKFVLHKLELSYSNILYNGGGNFYILASAVDEDKFLETRRYISNNILNLHKGEIYIALGHTILKTDDIRTPGAFGEVWRKAGEETSKLKYKKWSEIGIKGHFGQIFGDIDDLSGNDACDVCGRTKMSINRSGSGERVCSLCRSFEDLTSDLKKAKYYCERRVEPHSVETAGSYNKILSAFGYEISFRDKPLEGFDNYKVNSTDFVQDRCVGFVFKIINLPDGDFNALARMRSDKFTDGSLMGDIKLGTLKLDVDNLGKIFILGMGKKSNIAKVMELSRMMSFFFEGYIYQLIKENKADDKLYVVYSGGDDTLLIGPYNAVFEFALNLREKFSEYVCGNHCITFSAATGIFDPKYPVTRAVAHTEEYLNAAKSYCTAYEKLPKKDKIMLFGEVFNWLEFKKIIEIRDICIELVKLSDRRAVLSKVLRSTKGFRKIVDGIEKRNKIDLLRVHRLNYYLRELHRSKNHEIRHKVEQLIKIYEDIILKNLFGKESAEKIRNIMVIPCAVRWAELNTRKCGEEDEN
jgi:CRISPR-associated protein Csm1